MLLVNALSMASRYGKVCRTKWGNYRVRLSNGRVVEFGGNGRKVTYSSAILPGEDGNWPYPATSLTAALRSALSQQHLLRDENREVTVEEEYVGNSLRRSLRVNGAVATGELLGLTEYALREGCPEALLDWLEEN